MTHDISDTESNTFRTILHTGNTPNYSPSTSITLGRTGNLEDKIRESIVNACPDRKALISFSGGVDSCLIASLAIAENIDIEAVTIRFSKSDVDAANAVETAKFLGIPISIIDFDPEAAIQKLPLLSACDTPSPDSSALSTLLIDDVIKRPGTIILDGSGADSIYPSKEALQRIRRLMVIPYAIRKPMGIPHRYFWHRSERTRQIKRLSNRTIADLLICGFYDNLLYGRPANTEFLFNWFRAIVHQLGINSAMVATLLEFNVKVKHVQKYSCTKLDAKFPYIDSADLSGNYLHDSIHKHELKNILCKYLPAEQVYRNKMGFSMNQSEVFAQPSFVNTLTTAIDYFGDHVLITRNWPRIITKLKNRQSMPWFIYNTCWTTVCLYLWAQGRGERS